MPWNTQSEVLSQDSGAEFTAPVVLGYQPPIIESKDRLDDYLGSLVTIRGKVFYTKQPTILGVQVNSVKHGGDGHATGILEKWEHTFQPGNSNDEEIAAGQNNFGFDGVNPVTVIRYFLYDDLEGRLSKVTFNQHKDEQQQKNVIIDDREQLEQHIGC